MTDTCITRSGVKLRALNGNIIVEVDPAKDKTSGGIIIPDNAHADKFATGIVRAVGHMPTEIKNDEGEIVELGSIPIPGVTVDGGVLFVTFLQDQDSNIALRKLLGGDYIRVKSTDIILLFDPSEKARVQP